MINQTEELEVFKAITEAQTKDDNEFIINYVKQSKNPRKDFLEKCINDDKFQLMVDLLALEKLPINETNRKGQTPLQFSLCEHKEEFALKLIEVGADVNIADESGTLPLHLVMRRDPKYARILLENGAAATINAQNQYGKTSLHYAVEFENLETVCLLLFYDADTDIECNRGFSPFMYALTSSNYQLQELLLEYECDFDRHESYSHLLELAFRYKSPFVLEIINRGADIDTNDVLLWSWRYCYLDVFKELWHRKVFETNIYSGAVLNYITTDIEKIAFLEFVIESEELIYAMQFLEKFEVIYNILKLTERGYSRDLAQKAVLVVLSYGACLNYWNLHYIYHEYRTEKYENDEFFRVLLFMDFNLSGDWNLIPSLIFATTKNFDDIADCFIREVCRDMLAFNHERTLEHLTRYLVHQKLYQKALRCAEERHLSLNDNLRKTLTNGFPKLLDLARNKVRDFIHSKCIIRNTRHYYSIVERLPVPKLLIEIIEFRKSIY